MTHGTRPGARSCHAFGHSPRKAARERLVFRPVAAARETDRKKRSSFASLGAPVPWCFRPRSSHKWLGQPFLGHHGKGVVNERRLTACSIQPPPNRGAFLGVGRRLLETGCVPNRFPTPRGSPNCPPLQRITGVLCGITSLEPPGALNK